MQVEIIIAGFGGQGLLFAGEVLGWAAAGANKNVTWMPTYGPEMRGGTAGCHVIISDDEIGSPFIEQADVLIVMNRPSFDKYLPMVKSGGLVIMNRSLINVAITRKDVTVIEIEANRLAEEKAGSSKVVSIVALGAYIAKGMPIEWGKLIDGLRMFLEKDGKIRTFDINKKALEVGAEEVLGKKR